jgi:DHA1 family bicyclomycin/chloramphenicol resistance-like MFS transporter
LTGAPLASHSAQHAHARPGLIVLLALCTAMGPMCVGMFLPALPAIQRFFGVPIAAVQTTVSAYLLAFAISILLAGPLADRYGRRRVIIGGLCIFTAGSMLCAFAPTLQWLVLGRVVQAIGAAGGVTVARAVVSDVYHGEELARRLALLTMVAMVGTTISPLVGGVLSQSIGWHGAFFVLSALGITASGACLLLLPETRQIDATNRSRQALWREGRKVIAQPIFLGYVIQAGMIYAIFMAFIAIAPYVMQNVLRRPATDFGLWYMLLSCGYFFGNLFVSRSARSVSPERQMTVGLAIQAGAAAFGLLFVALGHWEPWYIFGPMLPLAFGQGLSLPHITARAVQLAPGYNGVASALIGFSQQAIAGLSVQAMGFASSDSPLPIMLFCAVASALGLASVFVLRARDAH